MKGFDFPKNVSVSILKRDQLRKESRNVQSRHVRISDFRTDDFGNAGIVLLAGPREYYVLRDSGDWLANVPRCADGGIATRLIPVPFGI